MEQKEPTMEEAEVMESHKAEPEAKVPKPEPMGTPEKAPLKVEMQWKGRLSKKQELKEAWSVGDPGRRWKAVVEKDEKTGRITGHLVPVDWPVEIGGVKKVTVHCLMEDKSEPDEWKVKTKLPGRVVAGGLHRVFSIDKDPFEDRRSERLLTIRLTYHWADHPPPLVSQLELTPVDLSFETGKLADFVIEAKGGVLKVNKSLLAMNSRVIRDIIESGPIDQAGMSMENVSVEAVKALVEFLCGHKRIDCAKPGLIRELNHIAFKYEVEALKVGLARWMRCALDRGSAELRTALAVAEVSKNHRLLRRVAVKITEAKKAGPLPEDLCAELCEPDRRENLFYELLFHLND